MFVDLILLDVRLPTLMESKPLAESETFRPFLKSSS